MPPETRSITSAAGLKDLVGQEIGVGQWLEVTQERVDAFAALTGDDQFIHVDPVRARGTMFGGTVAHGYLTLSLLPLLRRDWDGLTLTAQTLGGRLAVNYGLDRLRFPGPVRVGKRIRLHTRLLAVAEIHPGAGPHGKPQAVHLAMRQTVEVEGEERPGLVAETLTRIYF